jgi:hypothetical protein
MQAAGLDVERVEIEPDGKIVILPKPAKPLTGWEHYIEATGNLLTPIRPFVGLITEDDLQTLRLIANRSALLSEHWMRLSALKAKGLIERTAKREPWRLTARGREEVADAKRA